MEIKQTTEPIIKEVLLNAPAARVWQAITSKNQMKEWYFDIPAFEARVGFEFVLDGNCDGVSTPTSCKIIEVVENRRLAYTWSYDKYPAETIVTFELTPVGDKTKLRLTHEGLEKIPTTDRTFSKEDHSEGWSEFIEIALKKYVEL